MSLWHKIFGSPAEQSAKLADEPQDELSSVPAEDLRDEPRDAGGFADAHVDEDIAADIVDEAGEGEEGLAADDDAAGERRRGRPRRRRGRGRGRRTESSGESRGEGERGSRTSERGRDEDDLDDDALDDLAGSETGGDVADSVEDDEDGEEALADAGGSRARSSLRGTIPSWDEAIGYIVDTNMQSRSQRRPPARQGGRGDGGRGRSRGRRRPQ